MAFEAMQPDGSELVNFYIYIYIYIYDCDKHIIIKMSKFEDTKLCHIAGNPDELSELQEVIN